MNVAPATLLGGDLKVLLVRLGRYARPYVPQIVASMVLMTLYAGANTAAAGLAKVLIDYVLPADGLAKLPEAWQGLGYSRLDILVYLTFAGLGLAVVIGLSGYTNETLRAWVAGRILVDLQNELCRYLLRLPMRFYHRNKVGDLMSRVTNDIGTTGLALSLILGDILLQPIFLAVSIVACLLLSWQLSLVVFVGFPLIAWPIVHFGRKIRRSSHKRLLLLAELVGAMQQMFGGIRVVKAFRGEAREYERFRGVNNEAFRRGMKVQKAAIGGRSLVEFLTHFTAPIVILLGGYLVILDPWKWHLSAGDLAGFIAAVSFMYRPIRTLSKAYGQVQEALAGAARIFELMDEPVQTGDREGARRLEGVRRSVAFRGVHFAYQDEPVLKGVDFEAPAGAMVALVGPSGAGKSTILDLLARYYDPDRGGIEIDGVDIRDFTRDSLLNQISMVTQEPYLFHASAAYNIRYGRPDATELDLRAAARAAQVDKVIEALPQGYDTPVGERGALLSGGERQRLTIARALLKGGSLLLLDEATSSLDSESERLVQQALDRLMEGRTCFVIAHRLSTVLHADLILVVEGGRIVEKGTHAELLAAKGLYERLYRMQFDRPGESGRDGAGS